MYPVSKSDLRSLGMEELLREVRSHIMNYTPVRKRLDKLPDKYQYRVLTKCAKLVRERNRLPTLEEVQTVVDEVEEIMVDELANERATAFRRQHGIGQHGTGMFRGGRIRTF